MRSIHLHAAAATTLPPWSLHLSGRRAVPGMAPLQPKRFVSPARRISQQRPVAAARPRSRPCRRASYACTSFGNADTSAP